MSRRRIKNISRLAAAVASFWLGSAGAEERALGLGEALSLAKQNNKDLAAARARLEQSAVTVEQARNALLPTLAAQGKYTHNNVGAQINYALFNQGVLGLTDTLRLANAAAPPSAQNPALDPALTDYQNALNAANPKPIVIQKQEQLDGSINASIPLVAPASYAQLSSAKHTYAASQANFQVTETDLLLAVAQAFYAAAGADELWTARSHAVEVSGQTWNISKAKYQVGTAKRTDANQAELAHLRAQQSLREADALRSQTYRSLATLIQLADPFRVAAGPVESASESPPELVEHAYRTRPELAAYQANAAAYRAQINAANWRWSPTLTGFGQARIGNYAGFTGLNYNYSAGATLDWVLYDANNRTSQRHLAEHQLSEVEARYSAERDTIRDDILTALENVRTRGDALATAEQSATLAQETLQLTRAGYDAGTATQLDVLQAQDSLILAEVTQARARFDLALAKLTLDRSAGFFPEKQP